jgi:hypothetical protein
MIARVGNTIVFLLGTLIAGYMFPRVRSKPQTSTYHCSLDESVHSENDAILLPNGDGLRGVITMPSTSSMLIIDCLNRKGFRVKVFPTIPNQVSSDGG